MNKFKSLAHAAKVAAVAGVCSLPMIVHAALDLSGITGAVSSLEIIAALVLIGGVIAAILFARMGVHRTLGMIK